MTDRDSEAKSKAYQTKTPRIAKRLDAVMKGAHKSLSTAVSSILGDLRSQGAFRTKAEAYEWLKKTPTMDAVNALMKQAEALPGPQKRKLMRQIMAGAKASRMSRLEALDASLQINHALIVEGVKRDVAPVVKSVVKDAYLRQEFQLQKGVGVGWAVDEPPAGQIVAGMNSTLEAMAEWYHGPLDQKLRDSIVEGIATGKTHSQIAKDLEQYQVPPARAKAVARTMVTTVSNEAELKALKETKIKRYEYVATLDERTCPVCGGLDGKTFPLDKAKAGVNFPPMHPNCRCVHVAALSKDIKDELTRSARDKNGKTVTVPADMTYAEWVQKFGSDRARKVLEKTKAKAKDASKLKVSGTGPRYARDVPTRERRAVTTSDFGTDFTSTPKRKKNTERMVTYLNGKEDADPNAVAVIQSLMSNKDTPDFEIRYSDNSKISPDIHKPKLEIPDQSDPKRKTRMGSVFHEMTHMADFFHRRNKGNWRLATESDDALTKAIESTSSDIPEHTAKLFSDYRTEYTRLRDEIRAKGDEWRGRIDVMLKDMKEGKVSSKECKAEIDRYNDWVRTVNRDVDDTMRSDVLGGGVDMLEDIYDALSGGAFQDGRTTIYGHGKTYYRVKGHREAELIANYTSLSIERPDLIAQLRMDKPDLCRELDRVMYELGE